MSDSRARKIAVVADGLLVQRLPQLRNDGYGVMQLPPASLDPDTASAWLEQTAEQIAEYRRNDYQVVLVDDGVWAAGLAGALERLGIEPLPRG
ncbi:MAG: hypothetical protein H0V40_12635 [Actinobacteria bacterium]|nr:hypothetical protein [Actinomycetota bacterium]